MKQAIALTNKVSGEARGILSRVIKRDFSGYTGMAIKNSVFQFTSSIIFKIGSLLFTAIIARMLLPELFGLYSLALSTIVFITAFSDLGIGTTLITFISKELSKKDGNPGGYVKYLFSIRKYLIFLVSGILIFASYYISNYYYKQPIFLALLAGTMYVYIYSFISLYSVTFQAINKFETNIYKEIIFQISRLVFVPLAIFLFISSSKEILLLFIFLAVIFAYFLSFIYLYIKKPSFTYKRDLNQKEKRIVWENIIPLALTLILTIVFGYIDISVLGKFVEMSYVGYYSSAMMLISAIASLLGFSIALFPLFSRLKGAKLRLALNRTLLVIIPVLLVAIFITFVSSKYIILLVYGDTFVPSLPVLKVLALLLLIDPLIAIYSSYHLILGNQKYLVKSMLFVTLLDLVLTLFLVNFFLNYSQNLAIIGVAASLVISKGLYLILLVSKRKASLKSSSNN